MKTILAVILLSAAALAADQAPPVSAVTAACGPADVKFSVRSGGRQAAAQPENGKALVYVVEQFDKPRNEVGKPTLRVGLDGAWVGADRGTSYVSFAVAPGEHHLCTDWQSTPPWLRVVPSLAVLTAEASRTYYFRARVAENTGYFTLDLEPVNPDQGQMLVETAPASVYRRKD